MLWAVVIARRCFPLPFQTGNPFRRCAPQQCGMFSRILARSRKFGHGAASPTRYNRGRYSYFQRFFPQKAKRSKFQEKPHLEGAEFTKSSQLVVKTAAEILCHCSYALSAEEKQVGRVNRTKTIRVFWSDGSCIEQFPPEFMLPKTTTIVGYSWDILKLEDFKRKLK